MSGESSGPTRGAFEESSDRRWDASPIGAAIVRAAVIVAPIVGAFIGLLLITDMLYRPAGRWGTALWFVQAIVAGTALSMTIERLARQMLPLASLFTMSLVFPDQAPSRFGVALRAGTMKRLRERAAADPGAPELGADVGEAAGRALAYVTALGRHDRLTRGHTERVRAYADLIAEEMGLDDNDRQKLTWGVMLHDIGKVTVPPEVLNKTAKLTDEEWATLRGHPAAGGKLLAPLREWLGPWALAASEHHERWDGGGYPRGLRGPEISLAGRITAVADAYDVITSRRSYKEPMSAAAARRELVLCAGSQFDPDVVRAFLNVSLGRRWSAGVFAAASHLPLANLGTAPVAVTVGTVASVGALAVAPPPQIVEQLAFEAPATTVPAPAESIVDDLPEPETTVIELTTTAAPTTIGTDSSSTTTTTSTPPTSPSTTSTTTTATTAPSTTAATTATTAATTVSTTAPPTTTPPTTTSTTVPPGVVYYLKNPGSDGQDTTSQLFKPMEPSAPTDPVQYNFDTERDSWPGLGLSPTGSGWAQAGTAQIQRFFLDASNQTLSGPVTLHLWMATEAQGATVPVRVGLGDCPPAVWTWSWSCPDPSIVETVVDVSTWVGDGFQEVVIDLGDPSHAFGDDRTVTVRVLTEGSQKVHTAFDSTLHPSRIRLTLS